MLPLRGKILNVERARFDRMLGSEQIGNLVMALGTSIGREEFNIDKLRYHQIIIMTDADVDGAHIRTLLLTFFYRQMRELIDRGHIYIAQPPLYKVKARFVRAVPQGRTRARGLPHRRRHRRRAVHHAVRQRPRRAPISSTSRSRRATSSIRSRPSTRATRASSLEQAAIVGALDPDARGSIRRARGEIGARIANRMDRISDEVERGWSGRVRRRRAASSSRAPCAASPSGTSSMPASCTSADARKMRQMIERAGDLYRRRRPRSPARTQHADIFGPSSLFAAITAAGRKGVSLQRYKGLGEMNPEQLWETTLDPNVRTLLKVEIKDTDDHDRLFSELMGDLVEPRRDFINANALNVANLDV